MAVINFANEVMADGPIGFWRLGEPLGSMTAADSSVNQMTATPNGNNGTCSPSGITFGQPGFHGGDTAALFDGVRGRIIVHNSESLNPPHITMEAKVRWDGWSKLLTNWPGVAGYLTQRILEKSYSDQSGSQYNLTIGSDGHLQVEIRTNAHGNTVTAKSPPGWLRKEQRPM